MGCCCSKDDEEAVQIGEPSERTRLLQDHIATNFDADVSPNDYGNHYSRSTNQKTDEYTALKKVLQNTESKVIDVGAPDFQGLEEHEYSERGRHYAAALSKLNIPQHLLRKKKTFLLADVPGVEKLLSGPAISSADFNFMNEATEALNCEVEDIKIEYNEDLVVPFGNL